MADLPAPFYGWPRLSPISAWRTARRIEKNDSSNASLCAAATSSYTTALHVPHATRAVRLPSFTTLVHPGALTRDRHPNIAIHHARSSRGRQHPDLKSGSRRAMISRLDNPILPGLLWRCWTPSGTETTHVCDKGMHTPSASRTSHKVTKGPDTGTLKTLY